MNLRSSLYLNKFLSSFKKKRLLLRLFLFLFCFAKSQQIANYINNGGFEQHYNCVVPYLNTAKYWRSIDSMGSGALYCHTCINNVPNNGLTYQNPHTGNAYGQTTVLCQTPQCAPYPNRGYFRNRLKANLVSGKIYCIKAYVNISDPNTYGISNIGFFFVDNTIDTITKPSAILTYINPQYENPSANIIIDTMNWVPITGTFVANGTEKNCLIGNFRTDAATTKTLINSTNLPTVGCDILIDDVSCIPIDLPAYAGADIWGIPGNTVYIGRQQDVGIDEACMWYKLPNITTAIDTAAGMTLTVGLVTNTYVVKQDICGIIKWDTVIVHASAVGLSETEFIKNNISVFPNPANDVLNVSFNLPDANLFSRLRIINNLGQIIREEDLDLKNTSIDITNIPVGVYILDLISNKQVNVSKRFVISR